MQHFWHKNYFNKIIQIDTMKTGCLIENYFERIIYVENNTNNFQRKVVLPNNSINLMFQLGETIFENSYGKQLPVPLSAICGQLTKAKEYICPPGSKTIVVKFKPWTAGFFFNCGLHTFIDKNLPLSQFTNRHFDTQLNGQISSAYDKQKAIVNFLQQQFNYTIIDQSILQAINIIHETKGQIKVDDLAYKIFSSKRNFERKFKAVTGLSPKKFITNVRFQNSLHFLEANKGLIDIAYECGYCDPSHFSNDFKIITGITPDNISAQLCRISPIKSVFMSASLQYTGLSEEHEETII